MVYTYFDVFFFCLLFFIWKFVKINICKTDGLNMYI